MLRLFSFEKQPIGRFCLEEEDRQKKVPEW
jgi:hypothetical protein